MSNRDLGHRFALSYVVQPIAHVDLVGLRRQLYAQIDDKALRRQLGDLLVLAPSHLG